MTIISNIPLGLLKKTTRPVPDQLMRDSTADNEPGGYMDMTDGDLLFARIGKPDLIGTIGNRRNAKEQRKVMRQESVFDVGCGW